MSCRNGEGAPRCVDSGDAQGIVGWRARHRSNNADQSQTQAIRAELTGSNQVAAADITVTSTTPVLLLCRQLLAAGLNPDQAVDVFRGATLALRVRSIGEAARLEIAGDGVGFRPSRQPDAAPPIRK
ncbi:MAG TPA: hypothetical protein VD863_00555, partial [Bradyrhizobium sp.]|nr:hypothetical protein [Bradyrhizobium sp.]